MPRSNPVLMGKGRETRLEPAWRVQRQSNVAFVSRARMWLGQCKMCHGIREEPDEEFGESGAVSMRNLLHPPTGMAPLKSPNSDRGTIAEPGQEGALLRVRLPQYVQVAAAEVGANVAAVQTRAGMAVVFRCKREKQGVHAFRWPDAGVDASDARMESREGIAAMVQTQDWHRMRMAHCSVRMSPLQWRSVRRHRDRVHCLRSFVLRSLVVLSIPGTPVQHKLDGPKD